jgi:uncharacterized membrane protein
MNLMPPPGSSPLLFAAADAILFLHIGGGLVGIGSGFAAMALRKGSRAHALAGQVFVISMLFMAVIGAVVSPLLPQRANVVPALLTIYLVVTGWRSARDWSGEAGPIEIGALVFALCTVAAGLTFALDAAMSPTGLLDTEPSSTYLVFSAFPAFAAVLDVSVILRARLSRPHRLARHLWRMSVALFVAAGSLFLGQPKAFPAALRGSPIMFVPELAVLAGLAYWMIRVLVFRRRDRAMTRGAPGFGELPAPSAAAR